MPLSVGGACAQPATCCPFASTSITTKRHHHLGQHSKILSVFESCFRHHLNHSHATIFSFLEKCQKAATFGDYPLKWLVRLSPSSVPLAKLLGDVSPALVELLIFQKSCSSRFSCEIDTFQTYRLNENDWMRSWDWHWQSQV